MAKREDKRPIHFAAIGYEPMRMKPVHFATGFFLSTTNKSYQLELLNKMVCHSSSRKGLQGDYTPERIYELLQENDMISFKISQGDLKILRMQLNGVVDNDDAVFPAFRPYSEFGVDYTVISDRFLFDSKSHRKDGYAGHFIHQILNNSSEGQVIIEFAKNCISTHETPLERLVEPLIEKEDDAIEWQNPYQSVFGELSSERLNEITRLMELQTKSIVNLCHNLEGVASHETKLRDLIIGLCSWLFIYNVKVSNFGKNSLLLLMDFLGGKNKRIRASSQNSFSLQREKFYQSYLNLRELGLLEFEDTIFIKSPKKGPDFSFLDEHFLDLSVRIGFAQPRAMQVRRKHFELQPDTARILLMSVIPRTEIIPFDKIALDLRDVWGICIGSCPDDQNLLQEHGFIGLDHDTDLEPNTSAFIELLKKLNLAIEPSDGLVLCAPNPEDLLCL